MTGGDAETGAGLEIGGGFSYFDPSSGVSAGIRAHTLVAHAAGGYREWGVAAGLRIAPGTRDRGLSMSLATAIGADADQVEGVWAARDAAGPAPVAGPNRRKGQLDAELGYGLPVHGHRFTGTPWLGLGLDESGRDYRIGWRLWPAGSRSGSGAGAGDFRFSVVANRREPSDNNKPQHRIGIQFVVRR